MFCLPEHLAAKLAPEVADYIPTFVPQRLLTKAQWARWKPGWPPWPTTRSWCSAGSRSRPRRGEATGCDQPARLKG